MLEYCFVAFPRVTFDKKEEILNGFAQEGWRVVSMDWENQRALLERSAGEMSTPSVLEGVKKFQEKLKDVTLSNDYRRLLKDSLRLWQAAVWNTAIRAGLENRHPLPKEVENETQQKI